MKSTLLLFLLAAWIIGCGKGTPPAATPSSDPIPNQTATTSNITGSADDLGSLPPAIQILAPEYHAAYRLLPDGPWARKYIDLEFADFDYEEWQRLKWGEGGGGTVHQFDVATVLPMLQDAAGRKEDRKWIADRLRNLDPDAASQFMAAENVFGLTEVLRMLVDERGFYWEVKEIAIRYGGMKAGESEEFTDLVIEDVRDSYEHFMVLRGLGLKERTVLEYEVHLCYLLMDMVVGEYPRSVITGGRCDIAKAIELAERRLTTIGHPARDEESFRHAVETTAQ